MSASRRVPGRTRTVEAIDDPPRLAVADVLDILDDLCLRHVRRVAGQHLLERAGAQLNLLR
jgi:hypothetical protein